MTRCTTQSKTCVYTYLMSASRAVSAWLRLYGIVYVEPRLETERRVTRLASSAPGSPPLGAATPSSAAAAATHSALATRAWSSLSAANCTLPSSSSAQSTRCRSSASSGATPSRCIAAITSAYSAASSRPGNARQREPLSRPMSAGVSAASSSPLSAAGVAAITW